MDKKELLTNLKNRRIAWNESLINSMKENVKSEASLNILNDIIAEVEADREDDMFGIQDILSGMKTYCELFQGKCENCFFHIKYPEISKSICVYDYVKRNVEDKGE